MKDLIARYVYDVTRRLPENTREEVAKELNANIADMLPENPTEEDIVAVLRKLGEPRELAAGYRTTQRYLISPKWMDEYLMVLKIVMIVFAAISLVFTLIETLTAPEATTLIGIIGEAFGKTLSEVLGSLFRSFALVTLVFVAIDRYGAKCDPDPWSPKKLPELPKDNVRRISKTESIIGMMMAAIFGSIFAYLLMNNQLYIAWFDEAGWQAGEGIPLFTDAVIRTFLPIYVVSVVITIADHAVKLKVGHWNLATAISHTVEHLVSIVVMIVFVNTPNLLNPAFLTEAAAFFESPSVAVLEDGITKGATGIVTLISIFVAIDLISTWIKAFKPARRLGK
ncbi:MAG: hypothetical protein WC509_02400 [Candidatus Izemoplasmatales bacterium]